MNLLAAPPGRSRLVGGRSWFRGDPDFRQATGSDSHSAFGNSSLRIATDGGYMAGIYTQVSGLQPGTAYKASLAWALTAPTETFGRQLGIDPTGGVDPNSAGIVWGPMHWGDGRMLNYPLPDVNIDVSAVALGPTVTVFIRIKSQRGRLRCHDLH